MSNKKSIRFFNDHEVRAVWDEVRNQWCFFVIDIVGTIKQQKGHKKSCNRRKYLITKLRKDQNADNTEEDPFSCQWHSHNIMQY